MSDEAIGRARWIVIDSVDPDALVPFWCGLLGEPGGPFDLDARAWYGRGTVPL